MKANWITVRYEFEGAVTSAIDREILSMFAVKQADNSGFGAKYRYLEFLTDMTYKQAKRFTKMLRGHFKRFRCLASVE